MKIQLCYFIHKLHRNDIFVANNVAIFHGKLLRSEISSGIKLFYRPAGVFGVMGLLIGHKDFGPLGLFDSGS